MRLPALLSDLAKAHGQQAAMSLVQEYGGREIKVPVKFRADHAIARKCGPEVLTWLIGFRGGEKVVVPLGSTSVLGRRHKLISALIREGKGVSEIVRATGAHMMTVRRIRAALRASEAAR